MDVAVWLRSLGLGRDEAAFARMSIDENVFPGLTHDTLKQIGVAAVGHRGKAETCFDCALGLEAGEVLAVKRRDFIRLLGGGVA